MEEVYVLKDLEQLKVLADPLRLRILEAFCQQPMTTKQAAQLLGEKRLTKLYHHVDALERVGLIKLVKTKKNRGTVEKYYQAVAGHFTVDRKLFAIRPKDEAIETVQAMVAGALEATLAEIRQSIAGKLIKPEDERPAALVTRLHIRTTQAQIAKLQKKLQAWLKECRTADRKRGEVEYGLTVAFYPIKREGSKEEQKQKGDPG